MRRYTLDEIEQLAFDALTKAGAEPHQAKPVARSIRRAEADDIRSVGLGYLPTYLAHLRSGRVSGSAHPTVQTPRSGTIIVNAGNGFAHPAFDAGLEALAAAARSNGIACLGISGSYSIGVLGHPVEDIADFGLVALAATNSPPNMTAWGGRRKLFGTNPLAFAVPRDGATPLVVDQATTQVTKVTLAAAAAKGEAIPDTWAFDAEGAPTTDASRAMAGSMAPFGGVKGANMALLVELLAAVLTGASLSMNVHPYASADGPPPNVGQFFLAIDPGALSGGFGDRLAALALAMNDDGARLPGDRRLAARSRNDRDGLTIDDVLLARIMSES
jgi:(2R)-3-sulfolactate dehydrogenase (NADP+)